MKRTYTLCLIGLMAMLLIPALAPYSLFGLFTGQAQAQTYYIDYDSGSDSNNGTSTATSWKRHPYMNGFNGTYTHQAGDHFIFKGGVTWKNDAFPLLITKGGNSSAWDYYCVDKSWFKGSNWTRPVFDLEGKNLSNGGLKAIHVSTQFVTIDNFEIKNQLISDGSFGRVGIGLEETDNIIIRNNYIHDWINTPLELGRGGGILANLCGENVLVESNIIHGTLYSGNKSNGLGIKNYGITRNNTVYDVDNGINGGGEIYNNLIYNIRDSTNPSQHENGAYLFGDYGDVSFYNNVVYDVAAGTAVYPNAGWGVPSGQNRTMKIYNNIIYNTVNPTTAPEPIIIDPEIKNSNITDIYLIYNNVVQGYNAPIVLDNRPVDSVSKVVIKNNVIIALGTYLSTIDILLETGVDDLEIDNNIYYTPNQDIVLNLNGTKMSLVQSRTLGHNLHSISATRPINYSFRQQNASDMGVDAGANLSGIVDYDIEGNPRPQGNGWDIGAYEYVASVTYGDVSGDGVIDAYDAALVAKHSVGLITLSPGQQQKAEVSGDGLIDAYDAALIAKRAVGLIDKFPVEQ